MKHKYTLGYQLAVFILFASLFLQSCNDHVSSNSSNTEDTENVQEQSPLDIIPEEILIEIFSYLNIEDLIKTELLNKHLYGLIYQLITGYSYDEDNDKEMLRLVGIENEGKLYPIDSEKGKKAIGFKQEIDFSKGNLKNLNPKTIPTLFFCRLIGKVKNLPEVLWPYLNQTRINTIEFTDSSIKEDKIIELIKNLRNSQVHTINLSNNTLITVWKWVQELRGTKVHTLILEDNFIEGKELVKLAKSLQGTEVHTVNLSKNSINIQEAAKFIQKLSTSKVNTINLSTNNINNLTIDSQELNLFIESLESNPQITTINLKGNSIDVIVQEYLKSKVKIMWTFSHFD